MNSFIKSLMEEKGLKQKDLAKILDVTAPAVSQWNDEGTNITVDNLFSLSKLFHVTVDELLEGKRVGESLEDKWRREYDINDEALRNALLDGEKDKVLKYFVALQKADVKFFELFEKKALGSITTDELKEWEYLAQFYDVNMRRSHLLNDMRVDRIGSLSEMILKALTDKIAKADSKAIVWELRKIYHAKDCGIGITEDWEIEPTDDYFDDFWDDPFGDLKNDRDIFFAVYGAMSPIEKDAFLNSSVHNKKRVEYTYELIKRGGRILYTPQGLNLPNYDYKDLDALEGKNTPVPELNKAHAVIYEIYDNYSYATYEQYQALINYRRMEQIEMEVKYKGKNPIKYWEYVKSNGIF